jgi:hypothetical protein
LTILLRLLAAGGWLANMTNQAPGLMDANVSHDKSTRARWLFVWAAAFLVAGTAVGLSGLRGPNPIALGIAAVLYTAVVMMLAGWAVGLVPFVALRDEPAAPERRSRRKPADPADPAAGIPVRVTGIVESLEGRRRLYRHRPATLTGSRLEVHPVEGPDVPRLNRVVPDLGLETIGDARRGTAWTFAGPLPAIRLNWHHGPVLLAFEDGEVRDRVFASILDETWPEETPLPEPPGVVD